MLGEDLIKLIQECGPEKEVIFWQETDRRGFSVGTVRVEDDQILLDI